MTELAAGGREQWPGEQESVPKCSPEHAYGLSAKHVSRWLCPALRFLKYLPLTDVSVIKLG